MGMSSARPSTPPPQPDMLCYDVYDAYDVMTT